MSYSMSIGRGEDRGGRGGMGWDGIGGRGRFVGFRWRGNVFACTPPYHISTSTSPSCLINTAATVLLQLVHRYDNILRRRRSQNNNLLCTGSVRWLNKLDRLRAISWVAKSAERSDFNSILLRGGIVNRTYGIDKNLYI